MSTALQERIAEQRQIERTIVQGDARLCRGNFGKAWKGLFPYKSAEELASRAGYKSVRTASYEISGERPPSAKAMAILMSLCAD
jgi:hypothetical protein